MYVKCELPDVQAGFGKGRRTKDQIANICWIIEKARKFQKNICLIDYAKAFDCVDHKKKLWKILIDGIPDPLEWNTCLLRDLYAVKKQYLELDMNNVLVQNSKRSMPRLYIVTLPFNLYAEYII